MSSELYQINGHMMHVEQVGDDSLPTVVFLHGFTGSTVTWHHVVALLKCEIHAVSIDLWGHGRSDSPEQIEDYAMDQQLKDMEQLFKQLRLNSFVLVGYSMGGRTALAYASNYPHRIQSLVLESASPGLRTESERTERRARDAQLAKRLQKESLSEFVDFWENIALFDSQKSMSEASRLAVRQERLNQNPQGLAKSLLGVGTGTQPSYWETLVNQHYPVLLITGELDYKFESIANQMKKSLPNVAHCSVFQTGHAIHVEKPKKFATIVEDYVKQLN